MAHADAEAESRPGDLVQEGGALGEIAHRAGVDGRDRGAKLDALGHVRQRLAKRHVGKYAGRIDARKSAPLNLARELKGGPPPTGHGDQADGGELSGHRLLLPLAALRAPASLAAILALADLAEDLPVRLADHAEPPLDRRRIGTQERISLKLKTNACG